MKQDPKKPQLDGVYENHLAPKFAQIGSSIGPDQNILKLLRERLPKLRHIMDWGAGAGRMLPIYRAADACSVTLVEPSGEFNQALSEVIDPSRHERALQGFLGDAVVRQGPAPDTLHLAVFVINCLETAEAGLDALLRAMAEHETALVVTNVFVPRDLARTVHAAGGDPVKFKLGSIHHNTEARPTAQSFTNRVIGQDIALTDSVQLIDDFEACLQKNAEAIAVQWSALLAPVGFELERRTGDDFGGYDFVVLWVEFTKLK